MPKVPLGVLASDFAGPSLDVYGSVSQQRVMVLARKLVDV
jgi:hypothetical protein